MGSAWSDLEAELQAELGEASAEDDVSRKELLAAHELHRSIRQAIKAARMNPRGPFSRFLRSSGLVRSFLAHRHELRALDYPVPRSSPSRLTLIVEVFDRTNFLGLLDRKATDIEFTWLALLLGAPLARERSAWPKQRIDVVLKRTADTVTKARQKHGRPHFLEQLEREQKRTLFFAEEMIRMVENGDRAEVVFLGATKPAPSSRK